MANLNRVYQQKSYKPIFATFKGKSLGQSIPNSAQLFYILLVIFQISAQSIKITLYVRLHSYLSTPFYSTIMPIFEGKLVNKMILQLIEFQLSRTHKRISIVFTMRKRHEHVSFQSANLLKVKEGRSIGKQKWLKESEIITRLKGRAENRLFSFYNCWSENFSSKIVNTPNADSIHVKNRQMRWILSPLNCRWAGNVKHKSFRRLLADYSAYCGRVMGLFEKQFRPNFVCLFA